MDGWLAFLEETSQPQERMRSLLCTSSLGGEQGHDQFSERKPLVSCPSRRER